MARPSKYDTHVKPYLDKIKAMAEKGLTQAEIAKALHIAESTFQDYLTKYPELSEVLKSKDMQPLIDNLENALIKRALGFEYTEVKKYVTKDEDGRERTHTEIYKRYQPPSETAIFGALNRFDPNYKKDAAYYELKRQELELKKAIAKDGAFDLDI